MISAALLVSVLSLPPNLAMPHLLPVLPTDEQDRRLLEQVHPAGWQNPTPTGRYNLVVIGAGAAGLITSAIAAGLGAKVALIERSLLGGDCLNVGCVPSKALLRSARAAAEVRAAGGLGVRVPDGVTVDFPAVMERMRRLRADLSPHDSCERYRGMGVDVYLGSAAFTGKDTIEVGGQTLRFKRAVIATGARATRPSIPGLDEAGYLTNESVFNLTQLPPRLTVLGGGPVGCELAQAFARFGSRVTLISHAPQLLPKEDPAAAELVAAALRKDDVQIIPGAEVVQVTHTEAGKWLRVRMEGGQVEFAADEILVGAGRTPNVDGLNLEAAGVQYDARHGVQVNDRLQTSNPQIYAAGDICSEFKFTHAADAMARMVVQNALFLGRARVSSLIIPWVTYTSPEVARVGLNEQEAAKRGIAIDTFQQDLGRVDRAILDGETDGFVKIHCRKGTDRIVGATIVGSHAGDMLAEIVLAMQAGLGLSRIGGTIHPYPTLTEAVRRTADAYSRTRLKPWIKSLLQRWLAWTR